MPRYDKLVRDRVPEIIEANGNLPVTRTLPADEMLPALRAKMNEELAEYDASGNDEQAI